MCYVTEDTYRAPWASSVHVGVTGRQLTELFYILSDFKHFVLFVSSFL